MNFLAKIRVTILIIIFVNTIFGCKLFQEEVEKTTKQGYYAIQPESILETLAHEDTSAFVLVTDQYVDYSAPPTGSTVTWTQSDYLYIVDTFYKLMLHDTLNDWHLNSMGFALSCADVEAGLQVGRFQFFKIVSDENDQEVRVVRFIEVDPRYKIVSLWEREFSPKIMNWSSIDLSRMKFDSEKALQIAENTGGQTRRLSINNACSITLNLSPNSAQYRGWNVFYTQDDNRRIAFDVNIDPFSGDIR